MEAGIRPSVPPSISPSISPPRRRFAVFAALHHRNYRLFFTGFVVSLVGLWMQRVAQAWLVLAITDSAFWVGLVEALGSIPVLFLSLFAGALADRFPKDRMVLATQGASMVFALVLAAVVLAGRVELWHVVVIAGLLGVANAFDIPARQSLMAEMVGREDLMNAIALNSSAFNASRVVGPAIGGLLIAALGVGICFLINGLSYVAVIVALLMLRLPVASRTARPRTLDAVREGLRYVRGDRRMRIILANIMVLSIFGLPVLALLPVMVRDVLGGGAEAYGWAMSAVGAGALIGALTLAVVARYVRKGPVLGWSAAAFGALVAAIALVRSLPIVLIALVLMGMALIVTTALTNTTLQTLAPDALRGRVVSLYSLAFIGMSPLGALAGGALAEGVGVPAVLIGGGAIVAAFAGFVVLRSASVLTVT